jgi:hypothetical protein
VLGHYPVQTPWASLETGSLQGKKRVAPDDVKNSWTSGLWVATCTKCVKVGQPARNPGLERRETWGTRLACGNSN